MPLGQQIAEFTAKVVSRTFLPGPEGSTTVQINDEGEISGAVAGVIHGTLTIEGAGGQSGTWNYRGAVYQADGNVFIGVNIGTWKTSGPNKWRLTGTGIAPDGSTVAVEADADLATRTNSGKLYEWN